MGYHRAGFKVVGVDIKPQDNYPFVFIRGEALTWLGYYLAYGRFPDGEFDVVHASPPCLAYSCTRYFTKRSYEGLLPEVRRLLRATGLPYVIENVEHAPMYRPRMLCGTMFGLGVVRHRLFESNVRIEVPLVHRAHPDEFVQVTGGSASRDVKARAMDIEWMNGRELNDAIPPAYTTWIGTQLIQQAA